MRRYTVPSRPRRRRSPELRPSPNHHGLRDYRRLLGNILLKLPSAAESRSNVRM